MIMLSDGAVRDRRAARSETVAHGSRDRGVSGAGAASQLAGLFGEPSEGEGEGGGRGGSDMLSPRTLAGYVDNARRRAQIRAEERERRLEQAREPPLPLVRPVGSPPSARPATAPCAPPSPAAAAAEGPGQEGGVVPPQLTAEEKRERARQARARAMERMRVAQSRFVPSPRSAPRPTPSVEMEGAGEDAASPPPLSSTPSLQKRLSSQGKSLLGRPDGCPICFEPFYDAVRFPCGHLICRKCTANLRSREKKIACPMCRAEAPEDLHLRAPADEEAKRLAVKAFPTEFKEFEAAARRAKMAPPGELMLVYGNEHTKIPRKQARPSKTKGEWNTHQWNCFIELSPRTDGGEDTLSIFDVIESVRFDYGSPPENKRPKYFPTQTVHGKTLRRQHEKNLVAHERRRANGFASLKGPPRPRFECGAKMGWGEFDTYMTIKYNPKFRREDDTFAHCLDFDASRVQENHRIVLKGEALDAVRTIHVSRVGGKRPAAAGSPAVATATARDRPRGSTLSRAARFA